MCMDLGAVAGASCRSMSRGVLLPGAVGVEL